MKRPLLYSAIAFGAGILAAWFIRQVFFFMAFFLLLMILALYGARKRIPSLKYLMIWGICFFCGYLNYALQFTVMVRPLESVYEQDLTISGYVKSACSVENDRYTFAFQVERVSFEGVEKSMNRSIRVDVYDAADDARFSPGVRLVISGTLEKPLASRNPGGFNYQNWLFAKKQAARMSVNQNDIQWREPNKVLPLICFGLGIRNHIIDTLEEFLSHEKAALMAAMLTGYRDNLTDPMEDAFSASGLSHIMAVSGANMVFILLPILCLLRMLGLNRRICAITAIPFVCLYILITGMEASILRAAVMALIMLIGKALDRKADLFNSLGIASLIILLVNPFMLFDAGFLLSFGATAGLGIVYTRIRDVIPTKVPGFIRDTLAATVSAQAGIFPLLILFFSKVSVISLFSNLVVVPVTGICNVLGAVCIIAGSIHESLGIFTGYALEGLLHIILYITKLCADVPWAQINMHHWRFWWIVLYYAVLLVYGAYGSSFFIRHNKKTVGCIFLVGFILILQGAAPSRMKVIFVDIGQGDCALIQTTEGVNCLIDCGGTMNEAQTDYTGQQILLPLLMHEGISKIDQIIVSHAHTDHFAGVLTLLEIFPVGAIGIPDYPGTSEDFSALIELSDRKGIELALYDFGDTIVLDETTSFDVLYPGRGIDLDTSNLNNTSLCGVLEYGALQILFTGDMEKGGEAGFFKLNIPMDCDILKVSHHGGKNATSEQFLDFIDPETAVISVGKNQFGHPSPETLKRLFQSGVQVYTTIQDGAVMVDSDGMTYRIRPWYRDEPFTFLN